MMGIIRIYVKILLSTGKHIRNVCLYFTDSDPVPIMLKMGLIRNPIR